MNSLIGKRFTARIQGTPVSGKIQVQGRVAFLCQNDKDGTGCSDKLGYKWSWVLPNTWSLTNRNERESEVTDLKIGGAMTIDGIQVGDVVSVGGMNKKEVAFRSGEVVIVVSIENNSRPAYIYSITELKAQCYDIDAPEPTEPEVVEVTMDQIAEKFGIDVSTLKVKK